MKEDLLNIYSNKDMFLTNFSNLNKSKNNYIKISKTFIPFVQSPNKIDQILIVLGINGQRV